MRSFDSRRGAHEPLCSFATVFERVVLDTIFAIVTDQTTPEQFDAAQKSLLLLRQELIQRLDTFHFPAIGGHRCVEDSYLEAAVRLKNLALMQPAPLPPAVPKQQLITAEGVVINLEEKIQTSSEDTYLGTNDNPPNKGNNT